MLFFNQMGLFVGNFVPHRLPLVVVHTISIISFYFWCMLKVLFEFE